MTPVNDYKIWLTRVAERYQISEKRILSKTKHWMVTDAKQTFYSLCVRDGICLYQLSRALGKDRCTIYKAFKTSKSTDKKTVDEIWKNAKTITTPNKRNVR